MPVIEIPAPRFVRYDDDLCEDEAGRTCDFAQFDEGVPPGGEDKGCFRRSCWRCLKYTALVSYGGSQPIELETAPFADGKRIPKRCVHCRKEYP